MTASWPADLPQKFLRDGYFESDPDNLVSSENSVGPAKLRPRSSAAIWPITGVMVLTSAQKASLKAFRKTGIGQGSRAFTFPDPNGGDPLLVRFHAVSQYVPDGISWRVTMTLEVLP